MATLASERDLYCFGTVCCVPVSSLTKLIEQNDISTARREN